MRNVLRPHPRFNGMKTFIIAGLIFFGVIVLFVIIVPFFFGFNFNIGGGGGSAGTQGFFISYNAGETWQARNTIPNSKTTIENFSIFDVVRHPTDSLTFYIGTGNSGIWKTADQGVGWTPLRDATGGLDAASRVGRISIARTNPNIWFVAVYQKNRGVVLKSEDGGQTFQEVYFVPEAGTGITDLWYDDISGIVYVLTGQGGFLESRDLGKSWRVIKWLGEGMARLVPDPRSRTTFYLMTTKGRLYRSENRGTDWTDLTGNFSNFSGSTKNQHLVVDPLTNTLYLGSQYGLIRSRDRGNTWQAVPLIVPPSALPVTSVALHPTDPKIFFVSAQSLIYKTTDGGTTWTSIPSPTSRSITSLSLDPQFPATMYAWGTP